MLSFFTQAVLDLFHQSDAEMWRGLAAIVIVTTAVIGGPILYWITGRKVSDKVSDKKISEAVEKDYNLHHSVENPAMAEAVLLGHVGEMVGEEADDEGWEEARDRKVINWNGFSRVSALDSNGKFFTGKIVDRRKVWRNTEVKNGGWVLVQRDDCHHSVWCSYEDRVTPGLKVA